MSERRRPRAAPLAALCAVVALASLRCAPAHAQGEGPRAFELAPTASQSLNVYGMFGRGNDSFNPGSVVPGGTEVVVNGGIIEYAHSLALAGMAGTWLVSLPFGESSAAVKVGSATRTASPSGIGDLQLTAVFGLVGSPALGEKEYETYRPRLALSLLTRLYVPTGEYDRSSPVNLGQNRWGLSARAASGLLPRRLVSRPGADILRADSFRDCLRRQRRTLLRQPQHSGAARAARRALHP